MKKFLCKNKKCKNIFFDSPSEKRKFCSKECASNSYFKKRIKKKCKLCKNTFYVVPSLKRLKCCSIKCSQIIWAQTIPKLNKGKKLSKKHRMAMSKARKGKYLGELSPNWKGDNLTISGFHYRVYRARGKANHCEICNKNDKNKKYDWANLTGNYKDIFDYKKMCISCHRKYDHKRRIDERILNEYGKRKSTK